VNEENLTEPLEERLAERLYRIAPDTYRIPLPTDFPVGDVCVYFLDGPRPALIDTGVHGARSLRCLVEALEEIGRRVEDIGQVFLSHSHVDHAGAARDIRDLSGCEVWAHPQAVERLAQPRERFEREQPDFLDFLRASGFNNQATLDRYSSISGFFLRFIRPCPEPRAFQDNELLEVAGGRPLRVIETLGHCLTQVTFLLEDEGLLFTSDHVLPEITPNPTLDSPRPDAVEKQRSLVLYQDALRRVAALDVRLACPGHGAPFVELRKRCDQILEHQRRRCDTVLDIVRDAGPITRKALSRRLFGKVPLWEIYLTLSEVHAAVELLEHEGRARVVTRDGLDFVEAA
jgi:glyoxylase-like metal-dependent hydrolase (beta-lactamase superfamily II)